MRILIILFLSLILIKSPAQNGLVEQWDKRYGGTQADYFLWAEVDSNDNIFMSGQSFSSVGGLKTQPNWDVTCHTRDFWLVSMDSNGNKLWDRRFGSTGDDYFTNAYLDTDGILLGGAVAGSATGDITQGSRGDWDYWMLKADKQGNKIWDRRLGGFQSDWLRAIVKGRDGGYLVGGESYSGISIDKSQPNWDTTLYEPDMWVVKVNIHGSKEWDRRFGSPSFESLTTMVATDDGGYVLGGNTLSKVDSNGDVTVKSKGFGDYWVLKIDSAGNKIWDKTYGSPGVEFLSKILICTDSGLLLAGMTGGGGGGDMTSISYGYRDFWIVRLDKNGNKLWDKCLGGNDAENEPDMIATHDGGFLIFGSSNSGISGLKTEGNHNYPHYGGTLGQLWLVKLDSAGNVQWDKTIWNPSSNGGGVRQTARDCYLIFTGVDSVLGGYVGAQCSWDCSSSDAWVSKFCMGPVAINELQPEDELQVTISPNPATDFVNVVLEKQNPQTTKFRITNSMGQTVFENEEHNLDDHSSLSIDLRSLASGLYFFEVIVGNLHKVKILAKQ